MDKRLCKTLICLILVLTAVISFFIAGPKAGSIDTHSKRIDAIDDKISTVLKLTATSTVASAGISAIPGDTATPISEKLADFSEYFLIILCVLYTEKYLLTILGLGAFKIIIPVACLIGIAAVISASRGFRSVAIKLAAFAIALYFAIPLGLSVSDMIYDTYKESIDVTISEAETLSDQTASLTEATENEGFFSSILSGIGETVTSLTDKAASLLKKFIETIAVLIVTTCVIPILVILFIVWIVKLLLGKETAPMLIPVNEKHHREQFTGHDNKS